MDKNSKIYPAPDGEAPSEDYIVKINGNPAFVYKARVSAVPLNQVWPGYQRPLDQTEIASFAYWDMLEPVSVEVLSNRPVESVDVRPWSYGIKPNVAGNRIEFQMPHPGQITVEVNGTHHALHLFANPIEESIPSGSDVLYFGPGIHKVDKLELKSGQTVYIAGGSIVHGSIVATGASDIKILGRGILDNSMYERGKAPGPIVLYQCSNVKIDGIVLRDPNVWTVTPSDCQYVDISNIKLIGLWRYNADGIDIVNCQHVTIDKCFVRSYDDSIVIKGLHRTGEKPVKDVVVTDCVIWNEWGRALEIGAETVAPEISGLIFKNCDIIRTAHIAMDIQHGDRALVKDVRFENIRFEVDDYNPRPQMQKERGEKYGFGEDKTYVPRLLVLEIRKNFYSKDAERGRIQNIDVKDVEVIGNPFPESYFCGYDASHRVENVTIKNLRIGGKIIKNAEEGKFSIREHVNNVLIEP